MSQLIVSCCGSNSCLIGSCKLTSLRVASQWNYKLQDCKLTIWEATIQPKI